MSQYNQDDKVVKKPQDEEALTQWEANEFIKAGRDILYFARNYVFIQHPSKGSIIFEPRDYQEELINLMQTESFLILNIPRQGAKSSTSMIYLLHRAIFFPNQKIGITSNNQANARDLSDRIKFTYERLPWFMKPPVKIYNRFSIEFTNGSSLESASTTPVTYRGRSLSALFLDELAYVDDDIAQSFWMSVLPSLSASSENGEQNKTSVIIASTPNSCEGLYAELFFAAEQGDNGFKPFRIYSHQIPGRDEEFKRQMLRKMTSQRYSQEFEGQFISSKATLINSTVIESIVPKEPLYDNDNLQIFDSFENKKVAIAIDVGEGVGRDFHALQIFDIDNLTQLAEFRNNVMTQRQLITAIIEIIGMVRNNGARECYFTVENNGVGIGVINLLMNAEDENLDWAMMVHDIQAKKHGIVTSNKKKMRGAMVLKDLVEGWRLKIRSKRLISELRFFTKKGSTYAAEVSTKNDDLVMSCVLFCNMLDLLASHEEGVYDLLNTVHTADDEESQELTFDPMPMILGNNMEDDLNGWYEVN